MSIWFVLSQKKVGSSISKLLKSFLNKTAVSSSSVSLRGKATPVKIPVKVTGSKSTPAKAEELKSASKIMEIPEVQNLAEEEKRISGKTILWILT
ncbi:hypothetical protein RIR_jg8725.t1 [Rhizophagus irregularis DAOM 181602=DAOM 197198]|nr:hypothetical protein RIR_jg8725.t1 [Rhizophagus irregularis DAOM 181602=DAOM 197198]